MFTVLKNSYQFFILSILCLIFICIKIPNLNIPYYWDEAGVYVPGIRAMAQNGISLLPNAVPGIYSRGHPLLFYCMGAIWAKLFGDGCFSLHLFALIISLSFIFILFYVVLRLYDSTAALVAASITLAQPDFFAQSTIVLPEVFLSLWAILTVYFFITNNKYYYCLFGALMVLTKESGVAIIAALVLYQCVSVFSQKITVQSLKVLLRDVTIIVIPLFPYFVFLLIQHLQRGYYIFPNHWNLLNFHWRTLQEKLRHCYYHLFIQQGRVVITWSFLILFGLFYKQIPLRIRLIIIAGLLVSIKIFFRNWAFPGWLALVLMSAGLSMYYYWVHIKYIPVSKEKEKIPAVVFSVVVVFIAFSSVNFLVSRYLLVLVPLITLYFFHYIRMCFQYRVALCYAWTSVMIFSLITYSIFLCNETGDDSPKYYQVVKVQQMLVKYFEEQNIHQDSVYCDKRVIRLAFMEKGSGYLSGDAIFSNFCDVPDKNTKYVIYINMDFDPPFYFGKEDTLPPFRNVKNFDCGICHGKLFKRIL